MITIGRDAAITLFESNWWVDKTAREICDVQLFTKEVCMPFDLFHKAIEEALGRPVWTHEFGLNYDGLVKEYLGERPKPTPEDIFKLIPDEKLITIVFPGSKIT